MAHNSFWPVTHSRLLLYYNTDLYVLFKQWSKSLFECNAEACTVVKLDPYLQLVHSQTRSQLVTTDKLWCFRCREPVEVCVGPRQSSAQEPSAPGRPAGWVSACPTPTGSEACYLTDVRQRQWKPVTTPSQTRAYEPQLSGCLNKQNEVCLMQGNFLGSKGTKWLWKPHPGWH